MDNCVYTKIHFRRADPRAADQCRRCFASAWCMIVYSMVLGDGLSPYPGIMIVSKGRVFQGFPLCLLDVPFESFSSAALNVLLACYRTETQVGPLLARPPALNFEPEASACSWSRSHSSPVDCTIERSLTRNASNLIHYRKKCWLQW